MVSEQLEIERLLSEIADEGSSPERIGRLEELLLNRPELQDHYARVVALHTLLKFELDLTAQQFSPLVTTRPPSAGADDRQAVAPRLSARPVRSRHLLAVAASVLALLAAGYWLRTSWLSTPPLALNAANEPVAAKGEALAVLRNLTQTAVSGVTLPARTALDAGLTLCSGAVWITRSAGQLERGYMVEVPPGAAITVAVDADAGVQNALAVMELDAAGGPTGSVMVFRNDRNLVEQPVLVGGGLIANWSQRNDGLTPKYYLFTGTHRPHNSTDNRWRLSDYAVLLDAANVTYLGWDDSGYTAAPNPTSADYYVDKDFDDISAIIQVRPAHALPEPGEPIHYEPRRLAEKAAQADPDAAAAFNVRPGQTALIRVSGRAGWQNEVEIIDRKSNEVLWRHDSAAPANNSRAYLISNNSGEVQEYHVRGRHKVWGEPADAKPWIPSASRVLRDESPFFVLGFEDGGDEDHDDYDDVLIRVRQISPSASLTSDQYL